MFGQSLRPNENDLVAALVWIYPQTNGERFALTHAGAIVGRGADCDIRIDRESISLHHAHIGWSEDGWFVEDLGSTNGVYVNDSQVRRAAVREPDFLKLGGVIFKFIDGADVVPPDDTNNDPKSGASMQTLVGHGRRG